MISYCSHMKFSGKNHPILGKNIGIYNIMMFTAMTHLGASQTSNEILAN